MKAPTPGTTGREQLSIVTVGHVDHGKSTVIGRLLADTDSLPQGKLEQVREMCERNARPFEYAFLLDALKDEQAQGITIDTARCFFKTKKRDYILSDAPGHVEFLRNMITGAARAEAALVVIDAHEGIQENTLRHGYLLSMLGIRQLVVLINKMDLVGYDLKVFDRLSKEYGDYLAGLGVLPKAYVPICARGGENIAVRAPWYGGPTVLELLDGFVKEDGREGLPLRFPIQDIYKFTADGDDRRIFAGTVETGTLRAGEEVVFYPSLKKTRVTTLEAFASPSLTRVGAGAAAGVTLADELYIKPGEILCRLSDPAPRVGTRFRATIFWLGRSPLIKGMRCKMKIGSARVAVQLAGVLHVLDASDQKTQSARDRVERHDVAEVVLESSKPLAFDLAVDMPTTGRFVLVDQFEIAAAGILLEQLSTERSMLKDHVKDREERWERSGIAPQKRASRFGHLSKFLVITGEDPETCRAAGRALEARLFDERCNAYCLGPGNMDLGLDADLWDPFNRGEEGLRRLGELARLMTDAGLILVAYLPEAGAVEAAVLRQLATPSEILSIRLGAPETLPEGFKHDLFFELGVPVKTVVDRIMEKLRQADVIPEYTI